MTLVSIMNWQLIRIMCISGQQVELKYVYVHGRVWNELHLSSYKAVAMSLECLHLERS